MQPVSFSILRRDLGVLALGACFLKESEQYTRVELVHRLLENMGETAEAARQTFESEHGWNGILGGYAAEVQRKAA